MGVHKCLALGPMSPSVRLSCVSSQGRGTIVDGQTRMPRRLQNWQYNVISCMLTDGTPTNGPIASYAECSIGAVRAIRKKRQCFGSDTLPHEAKHCRKVITQAVEEALLRYVDEKSDRTLQEFHGLLYDEFGIHASTQTISRALRAADVTKKENGRIASAHSPDLVDLYMWKLGVLGIQANDLVFVDESICALRDRTRKRGWSRRGVRPIQRGDFRRGPRYQILPALTVNGIIYYRVFEGTTNSEIFEDFVQELLNLRQRLSQPWCVLVIDNASIHRSPRLRQMCSAVGVISMNTPPFTPWKNPIERYFGELKAFVKQYSPMFEHDQNQDFVTFLKFCVEEVGSRAHSARGHFRSAGIRVEEP